MKPEAKLVGGGDANELAKGVITYLNSGSSSY